MNGAMKAADQRIDARKLAAPKPSGPHYTTSRQYSTGKDRRQVGGMTEATANTWRAIQRGQLARIAYFTEYAMGYGLAPLEAARVAVECEQWTLQGVYMSRERIEAECELVSMRKAAA